MRSFATLRPLSTEIITSAGHLCYFGLSLIGPRQLRLRDNMFVGRHKIERHATDG